MHGKSQQHGKKQKPRQYRHYCRPICLETGQGIENQLLFFAAALVRVVIFVSAAAFTVVLVPTAAFTVTVTAAALVVIAVVTAAALMLCVMMVLAGLIFTILAITAAVTAAGAGTQLLSHCFRNLFIGGSGAFFYCHNHVLIYHREHFIQLLPSLQKALAERIVHHILTQFIKLSNLTFGRRHTLHVFVAESFTVITDLAEKLRCSGILIKKTYASLGGNNFLRLSKSRSQLHGQLSQFRG